VRSFGERFTAAAAETRLDALVNNAGTMPAERTRSPGGHELTFATYVLAPLALTTVLAGPLTRAAPSRVINVSSGGMYAQPLPGSDWESVRTEYSPKKFYARTKREEVALTGLMAERLCERGVAHAMHPGWADTAGVRRWMPAFRAFARPIIRTPEQGADTIGWLGAAPEALAQTGLFWHDRRPRPTHYRLAASPDSDAQRQHLWRYCEQALAERGSRGYEVAGIQPLGRRGVPDHPRAQLNRGPELVLARDRSVVESLAQVGEDAWRRPRGEPPAHLRGQTYRRRFHGPDRLERTLPGTVVRSLPTGQTGREPARFADDHPLASERLRRPDRHLKRRLPRPAHAPEVGQHDRALRRARELAPTLLRLAVEKLALEAAEQQRPLGPSHRLVLDRPRHRQQAGLGDELRLESGDARTQRCIHRRRVFVGLAGGELDRRPEREPALPRTDHRPHPG
jgi:NAD(P)-dependent dehydrogenase (short-subunit alcohol dehydrogenase family)